jgi:hypothetical protein
MVMVEASYEETASPLPPFIVMVERP